MLALLLLLLELIAVADAGVGDVAVGVRDGGGAAGGHGIAI